MRSFQPGPFWRVTFFAVCAIMLFVATMKHALAVVEYCPATVHMAVYAPDAPASATPAASTRYSLVLRAAGPRTVSGTIAIHTADGWYSATLPALALTARSERWRTSLVEFTRTAYASEIVLVDFPKPVTVGSAFFTSVETKGDDMFGWDKKGRIACAGGVDRLDDGYPRDASPGGLRDITPPPPPSSVQVKAAVSSVPFPINCEKPFAAATVTFTSPVQYPDAARYSDQPFGETYVEVAVAADGTLDDAWVYAPSGNQFLDQAAIAAARRSRYSPTVTFCDKTPGLYLFRAEFRP